MGEFWAKYKDPRWQRLRLEKMQEANFECEHCASTTATLHVHHKIYRRGKEPWEYEVFDLECLCEGRHEAHHELRDLLKEAIAKLDQYAFHELLGYAQSLALKQECEGNLKTISPMHADGISAAFAWHDYSEVLNLPRADYEIDLDDLWLLYESRKKRSQQ